MMQTQMQLKGTLANFWHAHSAHELKYCERINKTCGGELSLSNAPAVHAATPTGHEGHVMPMPAKPPANKPANEKVKPKVPPASPAAKPPTKTTGSVRQAQ